MLAPMTDERGKGFMGGSMKFGVSDDASERGERAPLLPLRVAVIADLVPTGEHNAGASAPEAAIRVTLDRFDDLFAKLRPRIAIQVPSVLAEGRQVRVDLAPTSMKSFRPDGLCAELPLLRSLLDGRLVLDRLREGAITAEQARAELERLWSGSPFAREVLGLIGSGAGPAPAPSPAASAEASVSSIFDLVDMGGGASAPAPAPSPAPAASVAAPAISKFSSLIANVARSGRSGSGPVQPAQAIAHVERALGTQIGAILQHPEVRRLERGYRGLRFLIERAGSHSSVRFDVLSRPASESAEALAALASSATEAPVSFAIVDLDIDGSAAAFNRLGDLAQVAEDHTLPVLVNGTSRLLGLDDLHGVEKLDNKAALFQAPHQAPWRSAAAKPSLRWVSIAMNGLLGRLPYDKGTSRVREAVIRELSANDGGEDGKVWLSPVWALGTLAVASFRETGWPCRIVGPRAGIVGDLPVYQREEDDTAIPTEAFVTTDSQKQLAKSGVLFLAAAQNSDAIYVLTAPTAYVTPEKRTYDSDSTEPELRLDRVQLGDQLFVARLVQFLRALAGKLPAQTPPSEAQAFFEGSLHALFEDAPPSGPELIVRATGDSHGTSVALTLRPRRFLGVVLEELSLEIPLG